MPREGSTKVGLHNSLAYQSYIRLQHVSLPLLTWPE